MEKSTIYENLEKASFILFIARNLKCGSRLYGRLLRPPPPSRPSSVKRRFNRTCWQFTSLKMYEVVTYKIYVSEDQKTFARYLIERHFQACRFPQQKYPYGRDSHQTLKPFELWNRNPLNPVILSLTRRGRKFWAPGQSDRHDFQSSSDDLLDILLSSFICSKRNPIPFMW